MVDPVPGAPAGAGGERESLATARTAARAADDKLGHDTVILHVGPILGIADHFVVTSASNDRQVRSIVEEIEKRLRAGSVRPIGVEGRSESQWVLLDYGGVVVHVFHDDARDYYALERLWADAERVGWEEPGAADRDRGEEAAGG